MLRRDISFLHSYSSAIIDLLCCCSYLDAQVAIEEQTYYETRSTTIPTNWILSIESPEKSTSQSLRARNQASLFDSKGDDANIVSKESLDSRDIESIELVKSTSYDTCSSVDTLKSGNITYSSSTSVEEGIIYVLPQAH